MGLTLHYQLRLSATTSREVAEAKLRELHDFAETLPFTKRSSLLHADRENYGPDAGWGEALRFWASIVAEPFGDVAPSLTGDADSAMGFFVQPGEGCETAHFGLLQRSDAIGVQADWFWSCSCKTQYASNVSEANFVACHTLLVQLLDRAVACGFDAEVHDEGQYWETRDEAVLLKHVREMNRTMAAIAGHLSDALDEPDAVRAPIFEHPRFERLEMGGE